MKTLGQVAYEAYGESATWCNYRGERMPQWDELPETIRDNWAAAAKAVVHDYRHGQCP